MLATAPEGLESDDNLYAPRWRALREGASAATESPDGDRLLALAEALVAVGWRAESAIVFARESDRVWQGGGTVIDALCHLR